MTQKDGKRLTGSCSNISEGLKTRDWKTRHHTAALENAGLENASYPQLFESSANRTNEN